MARESFVLYGSFLDPIMNLSVEHRGWLFTAILEYHVSGTIMELPGEVRMAFLFIKKQMDMDAEKYQQTCEKRAAAGTKGRKVPVASKKNTCKHLLANVSKSNKCQHNENENVNDNENDVVAVATTPDSTTTQQPRKFYIKGKTDAECRQWLRDYWNHDGAVLIKWANDSGHEIERELGFFVMKARKYKWDIRDCLP